MELAAEAGPSATMIPILQLRKRYICEGCKAVDPELVEATREGDMICRECGMACPDRLIDEHSEWRTFANDDSGTDHNRVGAATNHLLEGGGLGTTIGKGAGSEALNKLQNRNVSSFDKNVQSAMKSISKMADRIALPQTVRERAAEVYAQVLKTKCCKGRPHEAVVSAVIYIACRQENHSRTFKEVCALTTLEKKDVGRCYKQIIKSLTDCGYFQGQDSVGIFKAEDVTARWCNQLGIDKQKPALAKAAAELTQAAINDGCVRGRGPATVASSAIYMLCYLEGLPCTARDMGEIAGLSESTVRQCYADMWPARLALVPAAFCPARDRVDRLPRTLNV